MSTSILQHKQPNIKKKQNQNIKKQVANKSQ